MKKILSAVIIIFFVISFLQILKTLFLGYYPDFSGYYFGSKSIIQNINPYLGGKDFYTPFVYPPFVMLFFFPFLIFSFQNAEVVWTFLSIIFLVVSIILLFKVSNKKIFSLEGILLTTLIFIYFPVKFSLGMGQINLLILMLISFALYFYKKGKNILTGIFFGLCILLKIFPILIVLYFLVNKKWKILIFIISTLLFGILLSFIFIKHSVNIDFYTETLPSLISGWRIDYYNQSLTGFLGRIGFGGNFGVFLKGFISVLILAVTLMSSVRVNNSSKQLDYLSIGGFITANLLINNFSWQHHFVWLIIPLIFTFFYSISQKNKFNYLIIILMSYFLTATNIKDPKSFPIFLQSHVFLGAFILWALIVYLLINYKLVEKKSSA